jgi:hypothetical protein
MPGVVQHTVEDKTIRLSMKNPSFNPRRDRYAKGFTLTSSMHAMNRRTKTLRSTNTIYTPTSP